MVTLEEASGPPPTALYLGTLSQSQTTGSKFTSCSHWDNHRAAAGCPLVTTLPTYLTASCLPLRE